MLVSIVDREITSVNWQGVTWFFAFSQVRLNLGAATRYDLGHAMPQIAGNWFDSPTGVFARAIVSVGTLDGMPPS